MNRHLSRCLLLSACIACCAAWFGCESVKPGPLQVRELFPLDQIRSQDKLVIVFNDIPAAAGGSGALIHEVTVPDDGSITLHLNKTINVKGRTVAEVQEIIKTNYVPRIYLNLTPTVTIKERYFFVYGEVRRADRYVYTPDLTVLKAIATSGGFTDFANRSEIELTIFNGNKFLINGKVAEKNPAHDMKVLPGEKIHVPRRF
jgi:polysaccharide export outer membrane protein